MVLIDSRVWSGAAAKGRSSSVPLLRLLRRVSALVLASGVVVHYVYIPSKHNPADPPAHGAIPRSSRRTARGARRMSQIEEEPWYRRQLDRGLARRVPAAHLERVLAAARALLAARSAVTWELRKLDKGHTGLLSRRLVRRTLARFVPSPLAGNEVDALFAATNAGAGDLDYMLVLERLAEFASANTFDDTVRLDSSGDSSSSVDTAPSDLHSDA